MSEPPGNVEITNPIYLRDDYDDDTGPDVGEGYTFDPDKVSIHSFIHSLTLASTHSFIHSLIHSFIHLFSINPSTNSPIFVLCFRFS